MFTAKVVLVDGSLQYGDVGVLLNLNPKNKSMTDIVPELVDDDPEAIRDVLIEHSTGISVLLAPPSPEMSELVTTEHIQRMLRALRTTHDLIVVDAWPWLQDATLTFLDQSDLILAMLSLEITNIKNMRQFLELADQLGYDADKVQLLLNRSDSAYGIRLQDVENSIGRKIAHTVVSDGRTVVFALNRGIPFVVASRQAQVSKDVVQLAQAVYGQAGPPEEPVVEHRVAPRKSLFARR